MASAITGTVGGAAEGGLGPGAPGYVRDFVIIGRDDNAVETAACDRGLDRPGDHRFAAKGADVLARDPLGPAPCRDHAEAHASASEIAATTRPCSASVSPAWSEIEMARA